jgi:hypothetical protein
VGPLRADRAREVISDRAFGGIDPVLERIGQSDAAIGPELAEILTLTLADTR